MNPILSALCESGLWLDLHCATTYYATAERQAGVRARIRGALASGDYEPALREMAPNDEAARKAGVLTALANHPRWHELIRKYLEGLAAGLERELARRAAIPVLPDLEAEIRDTFKALSFYDPTDILETPETAERTHAYINYISRKFSPRYDGKEGPWDRDTQFKIELLFTSGLFVWLSANVSAEFRGRKMGTELIKACEKMAVKMGFKRFSVPGPNRRFWEKMGYSIDSRQVVVIGPNHNPNLEAYKETR